MILNKILFKEETDRSVSKKHPSEFIYSRYKPLFLLQVASERQKLLEGKKKGDIDWQIDKQNNDE